MTTLLHEAAQQGHVAAATWLIRAGLNTASRNFDGKTAQDLARAEQHHAVVQLLQQASAATAGIVGRSSANGCSTVSSGQSTPTAVGAAAVSPGADAFRLPAGQQQQWEVYPEKEKFKNYPSLGVDHK